MTDAVPTPERAPGKGDVRVVDGNVQEFDGSEWVAFQYLPTAGTGGDGKPIVLYKIVGGYEVDG
jgi:hypothetical protein